VVKHFPHLTTVFLSYIAAFLLFLFLGPDFFRNLILPFGALGLFIAGMLYTYSFTASTGAVLLITLAPLYPPGVIAVIAGIGATLADVTIFRLIRNDLKEEVHRIGSSLIMRRIGGAPLFRDHWFRDVLGALILASPLPDEIGIAIMASAKIKEGPFSLLTFISDTIGIYLLVIAVTAVGLT